MLNKKLLLTGIIIIVLLVVFTQFTGNIEGEEGLKARALEEASLVNTDNVQVTIAGNCHNKNKVLYWFVLRDELEMYEYIPIEFEIVNKDEYKFVKRHRGLDRGKDIFSMMWGYGYSFFINNPDCGSMTITNEQGKTETIDIDELPFVYYYKGIPSKYQFWSIDGERELR